EEIEFLARLNEKKDAMPLAQAARLGLAPPVLQKLQRLGLIEIREDVQDQGRKTQRVIAWKTAPVASNPGLALAEKEERVRTLLQTERGPLPIQQLLKLAKVSRSVVERMLRSGFLESWEESLDPGEDPFDSGYTPPAHELNAEQEAVLKEIQPRFELAQFAFQ